MIFIISPKSLPRKNPVETKKHSQKSAPPTLSFFCPFVLNKKEIGNYWDCRIQLFINSEYPCPDTVWESGYLKLDSKDFIGKSLCKILRSFVNKIK
ncbi:unnamed protein product [Rhizophagus irregularis]|uniref:Uncharacterized protein n=1 Tax=Rhizophagus irregularis TaxID=588596 RepID=A0A915ZKW5_9GLOM|nr:unnamed protein product [Rhizophagus irregularis]CAB5386814.1 unnamed protein product [Rhizophagus irregularis]